MILDAHTHAFPDALAPRAVESLESAADWRAVGDGTVGGLLRAMDAAGVDTAVVCTIATKPAQVAGIAEWCASIASDRIIPFPSVHPDTPDAAAWMARFADAGFRGIKLHPMYQDFPADLPKMDAVYAAAAEAGLLVTLHSGGDVAFPQTDDRATARRIAAVAARHESLSILSTHLGGYRAWPAARQHLADRPNVYFETSFAVSVMSPQEAAGHIRALGAHRVMFGTDWPWQEYAANLKHLAALDLTDDEKTAILGGNAQRLLRWE